MTNKLLYKFSLATTIFFFLACFTTVRAQETIGGPYTPDTNTVVLMHFDGDFSVNSNMDIAADADTSGSVTITDSSATTALGNSIYLDNNNDNFNYVSIPDTADLNLTGDWTMETWVRVDYWNDYNSFPRILFKPGDPAYMSNWYLAANSDGGWLRTGWKNQGNGWLNVDSKNSVVTAGKWEHITFIRDTQRHAVIQLVHDQNGNLIYANKQMYTDDPVTSDQPFYIGVNPANNTMKLIGNVDEVRVSNNVRMFSDVNLAFYDNVTHLEPQSSLEDSYTVTANIDHYGTGSVTNYLNYNAGNGWQQVEMTNTDSTAFTADIPKQDGGSTVSYYVSTEANGSVISTYPTDATDNNDYLEFKVTVPNQMVLGLSFEEGSGAPVDSSMFDQTVDVVGSAAAYSNDAVEGDSSYVLDGSNHLEISGSPFLVSPEITVDLWFKANTMPDAGSRLVIKEGLTNKDDANYDLHFKQNGILEGSAMGSNTVALDTAITTGSWYRVVYMISGNAASIQLRNSNNEVIGSNITALNAVPPLSEGPLIIGQGGTTTGVSFDGLIDNLQIYNYPAVTGPFIINSVTRYITQPDTLDQYDIEANILHAGKGEVDAQLHYKGRFGWTFLHMDYEGDAIYKKPISAQAAGEVVPYYVDVNTGPFVGEMPMGAGDSSDSTNYSFGVYKPYTQTLDLDFEGTDNQNMPVDSSMYSASNLVTYFGKPSLTSDAPAALSGSQALQIDAKDSSYIEIDSPFLASNEFTIDFWFKANDNWSGGPRILNKAGGGMNTCCWWQPNYQIFLQGSGQVQGASYTTSGLNGGSLPLDSTVTVGKWYHVIYEYSSDSTYVQFRDENDQLVDQVGAAMDGPAVKTESPFRLGNGNPPNHIYFTGEYDNVKVYNYAATLNPPIIAGVTTFADRLESGEGPFKITASVRRGEQDVMLHYGMDGNWQTVAMTKDGDMYTAELPDADPGTKIQYYISTHNDYGTTVMSPAKADVNEDYYVALVGKANSKTLSLDFESGSGTPEDASVFNNDVMLTGEAGQPTFIKDGVSNNWALDFNSDDSAYVEVYSPFLNMEQMTVQFWFKARKFVQNTRLISKETASGAWWQQNFEVKVLANNDITAGSYMTEMDDHYPINSLGLGVQLQENTWYRARYVLTADSAHFSVFDTDNAVVGTKSYPVSGPPKMTDGPLRIGHAGPTSEPYFDGEIDNVQIKNYADEKITDIEKESNGGIPDKFALKQNYPNPFNPTTRISYSLPKATTVKLRVFDLLGRQVEVLVNNRMKAGVHQVSFDASHLASGVYFYSIETPEFTKVRKMLLLK